MHPNFFQPHITKKELEEDEENYNTRKCPVCRATIY